MKTTVSAKQSTVKRDWYLIDATDKILGRLASDVASHLSRKNKPEYTPHVDTGDYVVIINAKKIKVTGNKFSDKMYHHHTGFIGNLKSISFDKLLQKSPEKIRPLINLARAHSIEGNHEDAIRYYEESLLKSPGVFAPNYNLGELYLKENRIEEAITRFKVALQLDPKIPETYSKLGEIYLKQKKWKLADIYFKKCIEIDNRFPHVFKNLGILHFYHLKNLKESLLYFSKSLTLDPNQKDAQEIRELISIYQRKHLNLPSQQGS